MHKKPDEVHRWPELLSYIQGIVDERQRKGMFVLTGSSNSLLMQSVSQSLAGRTALLPPWYENRGSGSSSSEKLLLRYGACRRIAEDKHRGADEQGSAPGRIVRKPRDTRKDKVSCTAGKKADMYFYRDSNGVEVDLVEHRDGKLFPVEIKSSASFSGDFTKGIRSFCNTYSDKAGQETVIYAGAEEFEFKGIQVRRAI